MKLSSMILDNDLMEALLRGKKGFPIQVYFDDLSRCEGGAIPMHWHSELEILYVAEGSVWAQIGSNAILLEEGECIFINGNVLHGFSSGKGDAACICPNIVFSGDILCPGTSVIFEKYLSRILYCRDLPYIILSGNGLWQKKAKAAVKRVMLLLGRYSDHGTYIWEGQTLFNQNEKTCSDAYEIDVYLELMSFFRMLYIHREELPVADAGPEDSVQQSRIQKMISFINCNTGRALSLEEIASSGSVSRSEAGRCFKKFVNCTPVEYSVQVRLDKAKCLLRQTDKAVKEIGFECGFQTPTYFSRVFSTKFHMTPKEYRRGERLESEA